MDSKGTGTKKEAFNVLPPLKFFEFPKHNITRRDPNFDLIFLFFLLFFRPYNKGGFALNVGIDGIMDKLDRHCSFRPWLSMTGWRLWEEL